MARRPGWLVTLTFVVRADSLDEALEKTRALVKDTGAPVANVQVGEHAIWEPDLDL